MTSHDGAGPQRPGSARAACEGRWLGSAWAACERRWLSLALVGCGIAMLPWLVILAATLPTVTRVPHWSTVWVGLDACEALGLVSTGWLLRRGDPRCCLAATAASVLLIIDAWFDVMTAAPGRDLLTAVAMAAGAELPMAVLCAVLAARSVPRAGRPAVHERGSGGQWSSAQTIQPVEALPSLPQSAASARTIPRPWE